MKFPLASLPMLDILEEITKALGHRLSLDSVAQATLGRGKSGHGLDALRWFKQGRFDLITRYCLDDVKLTKEVYEYGKANHKLFATGRHSGDKLTIPVFWPERKRPLEAILKMLREAHEKQLQVEIEYLSQSAEVSETGRIRKVDVYHIQEPHFEGHCHFRKEVRQFRIDRILDIRPTWTRYTAPANYAAAPLTE
jgi:WYL domain